jgi:hypothetical protein
MTHFASRIWSLGFCLIFLSVIQKRGIAVAFNKEEVNPVDIFNQIQIIRDEVDILRTELGVERDRRMSLEKALGNRRSDCEDSGPATNEQQVAFYASVSPSITEIQPWETVVFSQVVTNEGGAYNSSTGEFIAPVNGTYAFYSNILSDWGKYIETCLKVNGEIRMYMYSGSQYRGSGSNMALLKLKVGDIVNIVKHGTGGLTPFYIHRRWSTFSGFLLVSD